MDVINELVQFCEDIEANKSQVFTRVGEDGFKVRMQQELLTNLHKKLKALKSVDQIEGNLLQLMCQKVLDVFYHTELPIKLVKPLSKILLVLEHQKDFVFQPILEEKLSPLISANWIGISLHRLSLIIEVSQLTRTCIANKFRFFLRSLANMTNQLLDEANHRGGLGPDQHDRIHIAVRVCLQTLKFFTNDYRQYIWLTSSENQPIKDSLQTIVNFTLKVCCSDVFQLESRLLSGTAFVMVLNSSEDVHVALDIFYQIINAAGQDKTLLCGNLKISMHSQSKDANLQEVCQSKRVLTLLLTSSKLTLTHLVVINGMLVSCQKRFLTNSLSSTSLIADVFDLVIRLPTELSLYHSLLTLLAWLKCLNGVRGALHEPVLRKDRLECIMDILWTNWDSPVSGVTELVSDIFKTLLQVYHKECESYKLKSTPLLGEIADKLLKVQWSIKGKYVLLCAIIPYVTAKWVLSTHEYVPSKVIECMSVNHMAPWACELYSVMISNGGVALWEKHWEGPLLVGLYSNQSLLRFKCADILLPITFKTLKETAHILKQRTEDCLRNCDDAGTPIHSATHTRCQSLHAWIAVIKAARALHLVSDIPCDLLGEALCHAKDDIRADALTSLCSTVKKAEPVSESELNLVKEFLRYNLNVDSPPFREYLLSNTRILLVRLRDSSLAALKKNKADSEKHPECVHHAFDFTDHLLQLCMDSLFPGACYQRLKIVLGLLLCLYETFIYVEYDGRKKGHVPQNTPRLVSLANSLGHLDLYNQRLGQLLLYCALEYTNEIREQASSLLMTYFHWPLQLEGMSENLYVNQILLQALKMCNSPKTLECESGALLCLMVFKKCILEMSCLISVDVGTVSKEMVPANISSPLEFMQFLIRFLQQTLDICCSNPLQAAKYQPGHGAILACRRCLCDTKAWNCPDQRDQWFEVVQTIVTSAFGLVDASLSVLAGGAGGQDTAPSFAEMGQAIQDLTADGQDVEGVESSADETLILAWCWLNIKECSLLLGRLVEVLPIETSVSHPLLSAKVLENIGDLFIKILTQCRHRGAIESCSVGFMRFCTRLLGSSESVLRDIPKKILNQVLSVLDTVLTTSSVTRRSAGLPLIVECILVSENKNKQSRLLQHSMTCLIETAMQPLPQTIDEKLDLPQVHALNILKEVFRNSAISSSVIPFVGRAVILAVDGFASLIWAVRNSAMMLFGTLIMRVLGQKSHNHDGSQNAITAAQFFSYHPELRPFMLKQVREASQSHHQGSLTLHPKLFPVLAILSKLGPGVEGDQECILEEFKPAVESLVGNSIFAVRQLASSALMAFTLEKKYLSFAMDIVERIPESRVDCLSFNLLHGQLLVTEKVMNILERSTSLEYQDVGASLLNKRWILSTSNPCDLVKAKYLQIINAHCMIQDTDFGSINKAGMIGRATLDKHMSHFSLKQSANPVISAVEKLGCDAVSPDIQLACIHFLTHSLGGAADWKFVQTSILTMVGQLTSYECHRDALQLVIDIYFKHGCIPDDEANNILTNLLCQVTRQSTIGALCIPLSAILVLKQIEKGELCRVELNKWCQAVYAGCEPSRCETLRYNCGIGLQILGTHLIICADDHLSPATIFGVFESSLLLLEDENDKVRSTATTFISQLPRMQQDIQFASIQSTHAQEVLLRLLVNHHRLPELLPLFKKLIYKFSPAWSVLEESISERDVILFEQEDVNIYAERALLVKNISLALKHKLLNDGSVINTESVRKWLPSETDEILQDLDRSAALCQLHKGSTVFSMMSSVRPYVAILGLLLYSCLVKTMREIVGLEPDKKVEDLFNTVLKFDGTHNGIQSTLDNWLS